MKLAMPFVIITKIKYIDLIIKPYQLFAQLPDGLFFYVFKWKTTNWDYLTQTVFADWISYLPIFLYFYDFTVHL